ncbi:MAG TPA: hypothetical protein VK157_03205 [Phycisphaerales bacterium]|nr:hypothetical protein [Phycisphaerales bacterium]
MSNVEQLLSLCELAGTVSMSRREWEQRFPAQWRHLQLVLDSCDDLSEVVPRVDDPTQMLDVVSLPDGTLVACDPYTREVVEQAPHAACEKWQVNTEKLIMLVRSLIDGAEVKGPAASPLWNFGRWPSQGARKLSLYFASPSNFSELTEITRQCGVQGSAARAVICTWTDRFWTEEMQTVARSAAIVVVPIAEVLDLGQTGWCLSEVWPTYESALRDCIDASHSTNRQRSVTGTSRRRRTNVNATLTKAIKEVKAEIRRRIKHLQSARHRGVEADLPRYTNKALARSLSIRDYTITRLSQSASGEPLRRLLELVNDPNRLEAANNKRGRSHNCS